MAVVQVAAMPSMNPHRLKRDVSSQWSKTPPSRPNSQSNSTTTHVNPNAVCPFNWAGLDYLCPTAIAPTAAVNVGSQNGRFALMLDDGRPRLVEYNAAFGWRTRWQAVGYVPLPATCGLFDLWFDATTGDISLSCNIVMGKIVVSNAGKRPRTIAIDNYGVVRFRARDGTLLLTISPTTGATPASSFSVQLPPKSTTAKGRVTTTKPLGGGTKRTLTPSLHPSNQILLAGCRYVPVPFTVPAGGSQATVFNIELISCGSTADVDAVFIAAAQKWMNLITGDLEPYVAQSNLDVFPCIMDNNGRNILRCGNIDDLIIAYSVVPIDGAGKILGSAGPQYVRDSSYSPGRYLPFSGFMMFDSADWANMKTRGYLQAVVEHEMGHVLGFGTIWYRFNLLTPSNCDSLASNQQTFTATFTGAAAKQALPLIHYSGGSPIVESKGGSGTACGHWSESVYGRELMTGYVSMKANPLSYLTAYSLRDMGYTIDASSSSIQSYDQRIDINSLVDPTALPLVGCLDHFHTHGVTEVGRNGTRRRI